MDLATIGRMIILKISNITCGETKTIIVPIIVFIVIRIHGHVSIKNQMIPV